MNAPPLNPGERGESVQAVQRALRDSGYDLPQSFPAGVADGIYGSETRKAITKFQQDQQLIGDGIAGKQTLHKLDELQQSRQSPMQLLLTRNAKMQCPHAGTAVAAPGNSPYLTELDTIRITGCTFRPVRCDHVRWIVPNDVIKINGRRTLTAASVGVCVTADNVPTGPLLITEL